MPVTAQISPRSATPLLPAETAVPGVAAEARQLRGVIEDELAAAGWPWVPSLSALVDHLVVLAEER